MCKEWRQEECNHHFPELNKKYRLIKSLISQFSLTRVAVILVVVTFGLGLTYLLQTNKVATKGYQINELEENLNQLQENNDKLKLEYIELQSMANITDQVSSLNLIASNNVEVISSLGSAVARK